MSEERYLELDRKMFKVELLGIGLLRILYGLYILAIFWNALWATPLAVRIVSEIAIAFAFDWVYSAIVKLYITKVLARISPEWRDSIHIFEESWKFMKLSK